MDKDIYMEALYSTYEYIPKLRTGINKCISSYYSNGDLSETLNLLELIIEGLNWVVSIIHYCKQLLSKHDIVVDENELKLVMEELLESIENNDEILSLEILENEVLGILDVWYKNLNKIFNSEAN